MQAVPGAPLLNAQLLLGAAALLVAALLLFLYLYRPRLYIRYWILGWSLAAASSLLLAPRYGSPPLAASIYGLSQFLGITAALLFVISADAYRTRPRLRRGYALIVLPVLIWFALAPLVLGRIAVHSPGHLLMAGGFAAAGLAHLLLLRQTRLLGAALVGAMMLTLAAAHGWWGFNAGQAAGLTGRGAFINLALYLAMALGMQLMSFEDMTYELRMSNRQLESTQEELRDLITRDGLTGCRNRRYFHEVIGKEVGRHRRYNIPLSLLFIDVDQFKLINDTLGHEAGDHVLQRVAGFLVRHVRDADYVFRWGGDEFLILISCRLRQAEEKALDLKEAFLLAHGATLPAGVGLSIGCAEMPIGIGNVMDAVREADERMYRDKRGLPSAQ